MFSETMTRLREEIPAWFKTTALGKQIVAEEQQTIERRRKAILVELRAREVSLTKNTPALHTAVEKAEAEFHKCEQELAAARQQLVAARYALDSANRDFSNTRDRLRSELLQTTPACIDAFLKELRAECDQLCSHASLAVVARLEAIRKIVHNVDRLLRFPSLNEEDALARIEALRAGLPAVPGELLAS